MGRFRTPRPPTFDSVEEERLYRKQRLAATFRLFGRLGFGEGAAGHVTVRDPGHPDRYWVNAYGQSFRHVAVSDLILVDGDGEVIEGDNPVAYAALAIHTAVHRARPDVIAAAHTHSLYGKTWSTLGRRLDPISQDACAFHDDLGLYDDYTGVVLDDQEGKRLATALGGHKAVILRNHGILTVGTSIDECAWWYITLERCCESQLLAEAVGTPIRIDPDSAALTATQVGTARWGWFSFQPLYDWIVGEEPDLLD